MPRPSIPLVRALRWRDWATSIEASNELASAGMTPEQVIPFVDTSEVVEWVLPSSLMKNNFPTRLDISLDILFGEDTGLLALGPHAREINGVRGGWESRMRLVKEEMEILRQQYDDPDRVEQVREQLQELSEVDIKQRASDLVKLIRENHRWVFAAWRVPFEALPSFFDQLRERLKIPTLEDLELDDDWVYEPDSERVDDWIRRLEKTDAGHGEPAPNLIDAYAIDQLEQINQGLGDDRIAVLLTHSNKILEAIREGRRTQPDLLRKQGVSIVQPTQVALVWQLLSEAEQGDDMTHLTEELERQRERGLRIGELVDAMPENADESQKKGNEPVAQLKQELDQLDKVSGQWDALQKIRQNLDPAAERLKRGILDELQLLLEENTEDSSLSETLEQELDKLISVMDRLQGKIANRLMPPEVPSGGLVLDRGDHEIQAYLSATPSVLDRPQAGSSSVPSATYPTSFFRFRDSEIEPYLERLGAELDVLKTADEKGADTRAKRNSLAKFWKTLHSLDQLRDRHEHSLLLAVVYLNHEQWFQAYDMAGEGIARLAKRKGSVEQTAARSELLLVRAAAARAWAHASRSGLPTVCKAFLSRAVNDCITCLQEQRGGWERQPSWFYQDGLDARCLREIAVIVGSSREPVYGPTPPYAALDLVLDRKRLADWVAPEGDDPLDLYLVLARLAHEHGRKDPRIGILSVNTYLYALTEVDRRDLEAGKGDSHAEERQGLAKMIESCGGGEDPNFVDSLMWHDYVLALGARQRGEDAWVGLRDKALARGQTVEVKSLSNAGYYKRLLAVHLKAIRGMDG